MSDSFGALCDLIASDRFIVMTGAGLSLPLRRKADPTRKLPSWRQLLLDVLAELKPRLSAEDLADCRVLLDDTHQYPEAIDLITAASLLYRTDPAAYSRVVVESTEAEDATTTDGHRLLWDLGPRGILTFNYDQGHEVAADEQGRTVKVLMPDSEEAFRSLVRTRFEASFLLKAHGTTTGPYGPVLAGETYRRLRYESPAYRAFVDTLLADFQVLFVGFGLSDPDFDDFLEDMVGSFGAPLHTHVAIVGPDVSERQAVRLRQRFGIIVHQLADWGDRDPTLRRAATTAGPELASVLDQVLDPVQGERAAAHDHLRQLGPAGRSTASAALSSQLAVAEAATPRHPWTIAELAYSLGVVDDRANLGTLKRLVETSEEAEVLARSLTVMRAALTLPDLGWLAAQRARIGAATLSGERTERVGAYLEYLEVYVDAKFRSDPP
jgi:hypothetical protein